MKLYIPKGLNLDELIYNNRPSFKPFKKDKLHYILHLIHIIPLYKKDFLSTDYVSINATLLQSVIKNYRDYLNYLENDLKIIESDNNYIVGQKSKGFRIVEKYRTKVEIATVNDFSLRHSLKIKNNKSFESVKNLDYLTKWFDKRLAIDYKKVNNFLNEEFELKKHNKELWDIDSNGRCIPPINQYNQSFISFDKIYRKEFNCLRDTNVMRFHSNLTNMRSMLRNALTYNGEKLYSIDLKNSQPFISIGLFNNSIIKLLNSTNNYY